MAAADTTEVVPEATATTTPDRTAAQVVAAGANGVAVVSAVMAAPDVKKACRELLEAVEAGRRLRRG